MRATGIFPSDVKTFHLRPRVHIDHDTPHEVMRRRHHLDLTGGQIETTIGTAFHHALELLTHKIRPQMGHRNEHPFLLRIVVLAHFGVDPAAHDVARGPLPLPVIIEHEPLTRVVDQLPPSPAQAFLQHCARHPRVITRQQPGGMKLHHLHIAQPKPGAQRHGKTVHRLVARRRVVPIHRRPSARGHQHRFGAHEPEAPAAHVDHQNPGQRGPILRRNESNRTVFL